MNIGILGGTFDSIHNGHLAVAEVVRTRLDLAEILFVPAGQPWLQPDTPISAAEHRVEMVRLAIAGKPYFRLSTMEIERRGPSYTVDTIAELQAQLNAGDEMFFILGRDNLFELPRWQQPSQQAGSRLAAHSTRRSANRHHAGRLSRSGCSRRRTKPLHRHQPSTNPGCIQPRLPAL